MGIITKSKMIIRFVQGRYLLLISLLLAAATVYTAFRSPSSFSTPFISSLYRRCFESPPPPSVNSSDDLGFLLEKTAMPDRTVIITVMNDAYTEQSVKSETAILDIFLESFWVGEETRQLLDHLLIVAVNEGAFERCLFKRLNCYRLFMQEELWGEQSFNFRSKFGSMMWERVLFQLNVLKRGYNVLFTDGDVLWLRNPYPMLSRNISVELQIAHDWIRVPNSINTGFYLVRSSNRTITLFEKWYSIKERFPGRDQDALIWLLQNGLFHELGLQWTFLDNRLIGGGAEPRFTIETVNTVHTTNCPGVRNKLKALIGIISDWKRYKEVIAKNYENAVEDIAMATEFKWSPWVSCKRPLRKYQPRKTK